MSDSAQDQESVVVGEVVDDGALPFDLPDDPDEAVAALTDAFIEARDQAASHLDDLRRLAAEFENYRKRVERDRDELIGRATQRLVEALLPVLDSFDAALAASADEDPRVLAGMRSTHQQMLDVLRGEGLEPIDAKGADFDPTFHEAVSGGGSGHLVVTDQLRRGYTLRGRVIRPALVTVAASDPDEA